MSNIQNSVEFCLWLYVAPFLALMVISAPTPREKSLTGEPVLSSDSLRFVADRSATHIVAQVDSAVENSSVAGSDHHTGQLKLRVLDVLVQGPFNGKTQVAIPYHKHPAFPGDQDAWNSLDLSPGKLLLLAISSPDNGAHWQALSGSNLKGPNDPLVAAVRQAGAIERSTSASEKESLLKTAVTTDNERLTAYAAEALADRKVLGSGESARVLAFALTANTLPARQLGFLANTSKGWFGPEPPTDLAAASTLLGAMAQVFIDTRSSPERGYQAAGLAYALKSLPAATRKAIVAGVQTPAPSAVEAALHDEVNTKATPDAGTRKDLLELLQLWQSAHATR